MFNMEAYTELINKSKAGTVLKKIPKQQSKLVPQVDLNLRIYGRSSDVLRQVIKEIMPQAWKISLINEKWAPQGTVQRKLWPVILVQISYLLKDIEVKPSSLNPESSTTVFLILAVLHDYLKDIVRGKVSPDLKLDPRTYDSTIEPKHSKSWNRDGTKEVPHWSKRLFRRNEVEEIIHPKEVLPRRPKVDFPITAPCSDQPSTKVEKSSFVKKKRQERHQLALEVSGQRTQNSTSILSKGRHFIRSATVRDLRRSYLNEKKPETEYSPQDSRITSYNWRIPERLLVIDEEDVDEKQTRSPSIESNLTSGTIPIVFCADRILQAPAASARTIPPSHVRVASIRRRMLEQGLDIPKKPVFGLLVSKITDKLGYNSLNDHLISTCSGSESTSSTFKSTFKSNIQKSDQIQSQASFYE